MYKIEKWRNRLSLLRRSDRMSQRLQSSGQTILDTVQCNYWSFHPLQGSGGKFLRFYLVCTCSSGCLEPHDLLRSSFPKVTVMNWLGQFFPPYSGTLGQMCISYHLVHVMFRPHFYCHVPVTLEIGSLWRSHRVIDSFFGKSAFFLITHKAAMCWDPSYEYMVVLSQFFLSPALRQAHR